MDTKKLKLTEKEMDVMKLLCESSNENIIDCQHTMCNACDGKYTAGCFILAMIATLANISKKHETFNENVLLALFYTMKKTLIENDKTQK